MLHTISRVLSKISKAFMFTSEHLSQIPTVAHNRSSLAHRRAKIFIAKDKAILKREAKAINATVEWATYSNRFEISVEAPEGFTWLANGESALECSYERLSSDSAREAVRELLHSMAEGFKRGQGRSMDNPEEDEEPFSEDEPRELDFTY